MQIIITGGAGFLGQHLSKALLRSDLKFDELVLIDVVQPLNSTGDLRVVCQKKDLSDAGAADSVITAKTGMVFHLAAIVSSHAEKDFDLGWKVNLDITRNLLEACRALGTGIRFIFAGSLAVFGGVLPPTVDERTVTTPHSSYGAQKAIGELLVNDYSRKGFIDGRVFRLPTVCVRPGRPNLAASSFLSSIVREPINGEEAICPVAPDLSVVLSSPDTVIRNFIHGATLDGKAFGEWRTVNFPAIAITVEEMLTSLEKMTDKKTRAKVKFKHDETISRIVTSWPGAMNNALAVKLGFQEDKTFDDFILQYQEYKKQDT
ncbi:MAG TPA: D-erythronate dehydrogenase [Chryseolinea sp.]|nr:D-erythronate dehydrogenase [Chryseolinea sp.]